MLSKEQIHDWWKIKVENYIKNYSKRNILLLTQARVKFFTDTHKKNLEYVLAEIKNNIENNTFDRMHQRWTIVDAEAS